METVGVGCERTRRTPPPYGPGLTTPLKFSDELKVRQQPVSHGLLA